MSRLFDALRRMSGPNDPLMAVFKPNDGPATSQDPKTAHATEAVRPAVQPLKEATPSDSRYRVEPLRLSAGVPTLPFDGSSSRAAEQYRIVRTRILHHPRQPRILLVSSPNPGDGKTITAVNLAAAIALKSSNTVLLLDGDLRRPNVATMLGVSSAPGLAGVLEGVAALDEAILRVAEVPGLFVLPAGKATVNPTELFDSARWTDALTSFRHTFSYVVIDCPPANTIADYELLEKSADGVIVIVRPDHTNRTLAFKMLEGVAKEKQLGVVVNCATEWFLFKPSHPYYYGEYR